MATFIGNGLQSASVGRLWSYVNSELNSRRKRNRHCKSSRNVLLCIRAIQGHTGGNVIAPELMGHVAIPYNLKELLFHRGSSYDVQSIQSSDQDASLEDERAKEEHRPSSSHLSTHRRTIQTKKNLAMTSPNRESYTVTASGKLVRTPSTGSI